ncbi:hypothetical protein B0T25DRAFT_568331 [Lasiosphaeria hispida]|uniref:Uncharacterized protein n=1 Tax=Lasiosphaeria hispida TaxID=260671 RepID=A0AAJ0HI82_9PEZI|nr:hypothetical protein B0T25DRAFT_568331 [Lasiosphaeria hispida]
MAGEPPHLARLSSPDAAHSEANSSVQVHLDAESNRAVVPPASRSASRRRSPPGHSQSSVASLHQERPAAEDMLRDLIVITDSSNNAISDALQSLKRTHDGDSPDEPRPKRDRLEEELDRISAILRGEGSASGAGAAPPRPEDGRGSTATTDVGTQTPSNLTLSIRRRSHRQGNDAAASAATAPTAVPAAPAASAAPADERDQDLSSEVSEPRTAGSRGAG